MQDIGLRCVSCIWLLKRKTALFESLRIKGMDQNMLSLHIRHQVICRGVVASVLVLLAVPLALAQPLPDKFPAAPALPDYLAWARSHNPRLVAQSAEADVLHEKSREAGALPGLKLAWAEMVVPVETRVGPQQRVFSVSQSIPWFGTLSARENSVASEAAAAHEILRGLGWQVEREVRLAWYELGFVQEQIAIVERNLELARQTEIHSRARYESGEGQYASLLNAQMEIGRLDARLAGLWDQLTPATARLNIAAGLETDRATPGFVASPPALMHAVLPSRESLAATLGENNPALAAWRHRQESRRHSIAAAGRRSYPDLTFGVDYIMTGEATIAGMDDSGRDPVIARVAVNVPLWGGQVGAQQKASASRLRATSAGLSDTRQRLAGDLENVLFSWREAGRNLELYGQTLLPRSEQNLSVVTASYESGQAGFEDLQAARQMHLGLELALLRAGTDRLLALNDLGALLGVSMDDLAAGNLPNSRAHTATNSATKTESE